MKTPEQWVKEFHPHSEPTLKQINQCIAVQNDALDEAIRCVFQVVGVSPQQRMHVAKAAIAIDDLKQKKRK